MIPATPDRHCRTAVTGCAMTDSIISKSERDRQRLVKAGWRWHSIRKAGCIKFVWWEQDGVVLQQRFILAQLDAEARRAKVIERAKAAA